MEKHIGKKHLDKGRFFRAIQKNLSKVLDCLSHQLIIMKLITDGLCSCFPLKGLPTLSTPNMEAICRILLKNLVLPQKNLEFRQKNLVFRSKNLVFRSESLVFGCGTQIWIKKLSTSNRKTKFFDRKIWFFRQAPGNHMFMQPALIQRSMEKSRVLKPSSLHFIAG